MSDYAAGGRLRDRVGTRAPVTVFTVVGGLLVAAGFGIPEAGTLLFAWGGTALFVALLLQFVFTGPTVSAAVTTDIYTTLAGNARQRAPSGPMRYVPDGDGVSLTVGGETFDPVGERLLAGSETPGATGSLEDRLAALVDVLVNELELTARASATTDDGGVTVTATGSRVGTTELFDHPIVSAVGVALAAHREAPVRVDAAVEGERLVVTCRWSEGTDELLEGPQSDEGGEDDGADQERPA